MIVIDGKNAVAGRLAAFAAKKLLNGESVVVVNTEKALVSGPEKRTTNIYQKRRRMQNKADPEESAKWPRRPDLLFKRIVKGMLPKKSPRAKSALRRLRVFTGVPPGFEGKQRVSLAQEMGGAFATLERICKNLGWKTRA